MDDLLGGESGKAYLRFGRRGGEQYFWIPPGGKKSKKLAKPEDREETGHGAAVLE